MFWERFYGLCIEKGTKPNPLGKEIGISSGIITKWKTGSLPSGETLIKIADSLDCSVDYLLGRSDIPEVNRRKDGIHMPNDASIDFAKAASSARSKNDTEWISLLHQLSNEQQNQVKGYISRIIEESVAADESLKKTGTTNPGK